MIPGVAYDLSGLMALGYITASGNYVDLCLPFMNGDINGVASATLNAEVRTPNGVISNAIDTSFTPTIASNRSANFFILELKFKTTQTANIMANVFFTNGASITFN